MKKSLILIGFTLMSMLTACDRDEAPPEALYGKWKATEYLADPGDGSGTWQKVNGAPKYFTLYKDGTVGGEVFPDYTRFKLLDTAKIEFTKSNDTNRTIFSYHLAGKNLLLLPVQPMCIEPCGSKFTKSH